MSEKIALENLKKINNVGRILDISVPASVKIGSFKLHLKDILDLKPGSILEVEKPINSPLDLVVRGKVLAVGDVVTINENLGLRITEIKSK